MSSCATTVMLKKVIHRPVFFNPWVATPRGREASFGGCSNLSEPVLLQEQNWLKLYSHLFNTIIHMCKRGLGSNPVIGTVTVLIQSCTASSRCLAPQLLLLALHRPLPHRVVVKTHEVGEMGLSGDGRLGRSDPGMEAGSAVDLQHRKG